MARGGRRGRGVLGLIVQGLISDFSQSRFDIFCCVCGGVRRDRRCEGQKEVVRRSWKLEIRNSELTIVNCQLK